MLLNIILWLVLGALAGWIGSKVVNGTGLGLIGDIVVGIIGALIGGFIVGLFGAQGITGFNFWSLIVAIIGAIVLLLIVRLFTGGARRRAV